MPWGYFTYLKNKSKWNQKQSFEIILLSTEPCDYIFFYYKNVKSYNVNPLIRNISTRLRGTSAPTKNS